MVASFRYPADDLDNTRALLGAMGTFWSQTYEGLDLIESWVYSTAQLERQAIQDMQETYDCISRLTSPVFHTELVAELVLKQSELNQTAFRYGDGRPYGNRDTYGQRLDYPLFTFPLPPTVAGIPLLANRLTSPSLLLFDGIDYYLDLSRQLLVLRSDPFTDDRIARREVYNTEGAVVDYEVSLWALREQQDRRFLSEQYGYQWGFDLPSSGPYRDFLNALWDAAVEGSSARAVQEAISAALDIPLAKGDEIVEVVTTDRDSLLVITDANVYRFVSTATPLVYVGDHVHAGMPLTDGLRFYEFNRGQVDPALLAVHLESAYLLEGYHSGLTFENKSVPLVVGTDGMFTTVSFEIGGWPLDVEKFWDDLHARGVDAGLTLAQCLDQRTNKVGEPTAANLPTTINPLEFLVQNVLRNNFFAAQIRFSSCGPNAMGIEHLRAIRRIVPPHTALLLIVELEADEEFISMESETPQALLWRRLLSADWEDLSPSEWQLLGSKVAVSVAESVAGHEEDLDSYCAGEPLEETLDSGAYITEDVEAVYVDGVCV